MLGSFSFLVALGLSSMQDIEDVEVLQTRGERVHSTSNNKGYWLDVRKTDVSL